MRSTGSRTLFAATLNRRPEPPPKQRVMFLCLGNVCRSQMAEGFARAYGLDVMEPVSAGLMPGTMVDPVSIRLMTERGIDISGQFPKEIRLAAHKGLDLAINMSGYPAPNMGVPVREWQVRDPHMLPEKIHRGVRDEIENLVMALVMELRVPRQA
jgi:arsenate reductase (thioredoxin)